MRKYVNPPIIASAIALAIALVYMAMLASCTVSRPNRAYDVRVYSNGSLIRHDTVYGRVQEHLKYKRLVYTVNGFPVRVSGDYSITILNLKR